ncbi:hypothetical protein GW17_00054312 [Ensete ventricosum]|nr:hypothetical protein GW17_00054312 [Ensete ventricosum]
MRITWNNCSSTHATSAAVEGLNKGCLDFVKDQRWVMSSRLPQQRERESRWNENSDRQILLKCCCFLRLRLLGSVDLLKVTGKDHSRRRNNEEEGDLSPKEEAKLTPVQEGVGAAA